MAAIGRAQVLTWTLAKGFEISVISVSKGTLHEDTIRTAQKYAQEQGSRSDEHGEALDGLEAQVRVSGGDWDGGAVNWVADEGGSYRWTA